MPEREKKGTARGGRVTFKRGGMIVLPGKMFIAPDLKSLHGKKVELSAIRILGAGLEVARVYHRGQYVTDAFTETKGVPLNKKLYRILEECTEKQQGLYL
ncbi:hypothetical protein [Desulfofundulus thermosubterraneus]|uniref:Uncharacterized protein n=1 Tax=Desulfofundulus thermosubterraneus DSM 16057 TaxID=1121432 RepID=A0A1M6KK84_9FIRM|nr:hypothetical protein [Desulfofundulus thermosubterraneus]SHJ59260.1 hypothetical protein SAMN02745219_02896 [Desulfofundulus thermosubterraneus DSM 16057]